jgi:hypothetical protein
VQDVVGHELQALLVDFLEHLGVGGLQVEVFAEIDGGLFCAEVVVDLPEARHEEIGLLFEDIPLPLHNGIHHIIIIQNPHATLLRIHKNGKVQIKPLGYNPPHHTIRPFLLANPQLPLLPRLRNKIHLHFLTIRYRFGARSLFKSQHVLGEGLRDGLL